MIFTRPDRIRPGRSAVHRPGGPRLHWTVVALAVSLVLVGCTPQDQGPDLPPQRILQSVGVQMSPNGAMTEIKSTTVAVRENASDATTETSTYSPDEVADDLPVRVSTSYRTADRSGTNLAELAGYTGRVEIDITVQNLTLRPQNLSYDVAGNSRTQAALVGAPLTVVGSTVLTGVAPTDVITATGSAAAAATNGVLSRSENGDAVIQWAALLASPQMGANATLTLVADTEDFKVPAFDLSVQPGLVTDPSVSRVLESAFNTSPTSQLALEQRTIKVITDVNQVLTKASTDISKVRKNLETTSKTLGNRTVKELQQSTKGLATSVKDLNGQLEQLNKDIERTAEGAQSAVVQELSQTVSAMDKLLGDTSGDPPAPRVSGNGCSTVVGSPQAVGSVYGNLIQVSAQLNGYATASERCKEEARAVLLRSVGPAEPNDELCKDDKSTTCALWAARQKFASIMERLVKRGDDLIKELQPEIVDSALREYDNLGERVNAVSTGAKDVQAAAEALPKAVEGDLARTEEDLKAIDQRLATLAAELTRAAEDAKTIDQGLALIHRDAEESVAELKSDDQENPERDRSVQAQILEAAEHACEMGDGGIFGGRGASERDIRRMRSYLVPEGCPPEDDGDPETPPEEPEELDPPGRFRGKGSLLERILEQADAWQKVADATDEDREDSLYAPLKSIQTKLAAADEEIKDLRAAIQQILERRPNEIDPNLPEMQELRAKVEALTGKNGTVAEFHTAYTNMADPMNDFAKYHAALPGKIRGAFKSASDQATKELDDALVPQIRKISEQAEVDAEAVGEMFEKSAAGLSNAAEAINRNGARIIDQQRRELRESEKRTAAAAAKDVDESLSVLARGVNNSTRDINASFALLEGSLKKVLLDLGDRKVNGSGLLGAMTTSAARVGTADFQLALASGQAESYAAVRGEDVNGILLRQAQLQAALQAAADLPAFQIEVPAGAESQTVYNFRIEAE